MTTGKIDGAKLFNYASMLEEKTLEQATVTARLPFISPHVALMPDAHAGIGSAVGTVIPTLGAVIPAAVGVDIGCGMIAVETAFTLQDLEKRAWDFTTGPHGTPLQHALPSLRDAIESSIPLSPGNYNGHLERYDFTAEKIGELEELAEKNGVELGHSPKWREQLGSLGGGNHFIELCLDERDHVWLFLHSGSRGVGNKIAKKHIKIAQELCKKWWIPLENPDLAYFAQGTPEFSRYIADLNWAQRFAYLNRAEMMDRFVIEFAKWLEVDMDAVEIDRVNCHHNYTKMENHFGKDVWLTRKGAIDAHEGVAGVIPGSMGTKSYVVKGKGNKLGLHSAPHGAGRVFSRTEAKKRFTLEDLDKRMEGIEYRRSADFIDEIPDAYKDIDVVMEDAKDLVEIQHTLRQILNVKGT